MLNLIDHLPRNSHLAHARARDRELAEQFLQMEDMLSDEDLTFEEAFHEWSTTDWLTAELIDHVKDLNRTLIAVNSKNGNAPNLTPRPRPTPIVAEVREQMRISRIQELDRRLGLAD